MLRIDTHHHLVPPDYRKALQKAGIDDAGGRAARPDGRPYRCDDGDEGLIAAICPELWEVMAARVMDIGCLLSIKGGAA